MAAAKRMDKARAKREARRRAELRRQEQPAGQQLEAPLLGSRLGFTPRAGTRRGVLLGGSRFEGQSGARCTLDLLDLDASGGASSPQDQALGLRRLELGFLPHGMALNPQRPSACVWFEKWGPGAAYLELAEGSRLATLSPLGGHHFYGHGAFSQDASRLFAVETNLDSHAGVISVRDPSSGFGVLGQFPSFGQKPHDCVLLDDGVLVVTNGGGPFGSAELGNVCFIEVDSGRLLERLDVREPRRNAGHVALDHSSAGYRQRGLAVVSAPRDGLPQSEPGGLSLRLGGGELHDVALPAELCQRMLGESLSVCFDEHNAQVWVTNPAGNLLSVWPLRALDTARQIELASPRGVALSLDGEWMCVSNAAQAQIALFDAKTAALLENQPKASRVFGGSHLYTWAYPASTPAVSL